MKNFKSVPWAAQKRSGWCDICIKKQGDLLLTFDIEEWYHAEIPRRHLLAKPLQATNIEKQIDLFIEICERFNCKATCFIVGEVAREKPDIVKKLYSAGHDIASHSYAHRLVHEMRPKEFAEDLRISCDSLSQLTGEQVIGFRASSWSITKSCAGWYYSCLHEAGIKYSSSVYPGATYLYGMDEAPNEPFWVKGMDILEIPQELISVGGQKIGFAGGFYFRFFPYLFIKAVMQKKLAQGKAVFLYFHPWEFTQQNYPIKLNLLESIIQYWGIKNNLIKLGKILEHANGSLKTMKRFYDENFDDIKLGVVEF